MPMKPLNNVLAFLSAKVLTHANLVKTSITHKYLTPQFLERNDPIIAKLNLLSKYYLLTLHRLSFFEYFNHRFM